MVIHGLFEGRREVGARLSMNIVWEKALGMKQGGYSSLTH